MAKKEVISCQRCGVTLPKAMTCPRCKHPNLGYEQPFDPSQDGTVLLSNVSAKQVERITTGYCDIIFGRSNDKSPYGIAVTSVNLLGGIRGTGKSTLAMKIADLCPPLTGKESLYLGGEQSLEEIRGYCGRFNLENMDKIRMLSIMGEPKNVFKVIQYWKPGVVIVDSLPKLAGKDPETAVELCKVFKEMAVDLKCPFIIINHSTKDDDFAGFEQLQHDVDALIVGYMGVFEDPNIREFRVAGKNRFGDGYANQFFVMRQNGLFPIKPPKEVTG
jgi:predicted ATP-dependent serine protease